jgi:DNA-binding NtrC family response regulator
MTKPHERILIIDPSHRERTVIASYLRTENYAVDTASNLAEAVQKLTAEDYPCVILDVDLQEMKGYEAVPILKNIRPEVKIIMTTQKNSKELEAKVRSQSIFFYFIKSFDKDELKLAICNAFKKYKENYHGKCKE